MSQYTWTNPGAPSTFPSDQRNWTPPPSLNLIGGGAKPFGQGDWPNPTTLKPCVVVDFFGRYALELIGKDKFFDAPGQGPCYDWPNPLGYTPGIALKTHTDSFKLELIGKDKFFGTAGKAPCFDWPNPRGYTPGISLLTHADPLKLLLLGKDKFFRGAGQPPNYDWPNPTTRTPRAVDLNILETLKVNLRRQDQFFGAPGQSPAQLDWPNPTRLTPRRVEDFTDSFKLTLAGQDKFFGAAGQGPAYDWPNPTTRTPRAIDLVSWIATLDLSVVLVPPFYQTDYPNPTRLTPRAVQDFLAGLKLNLLGQDVFFGAAGQGVAKLDWPNPTRLNARLVDYFIDTLKLTLAGQDTFFGAAGQGPDYDWPNPTRLTPRAVDLRITEGLKLNLQGQDQFFGAPGQAPAYLDWPVPRGPTPGVALKSWWQYLQGSTLAVTLAPFYQSDYPNPQGYTLGITQRTFTDPLKLHLVGQDQFFGAAGQSPAQLDWPVPYGARPSIDLKTWAQTLQETTLAPIVAAPFYQTDYPNPRGATPGVSLRTHTDPVKLNLRGKDQFFGGAGQSPANLDWPVPQGYKLAITQRWWSQNLLQSTIAPVIVNPFHQTDYPNPRGYTYAITLRTALNVVITNQSGVTWGAIADPATQTWTALVDPTTSWTAITDPAVKPWSDIPED